MSKIETKVEESAEVIETRDSIRYVLYKNDEYFVGRDIARALKVCAEKKYIQHIPMEFKRDFYIPTVSGIQFMKCVSCIGLKWLQKHSRVNGVVELVDNLLKSDK